MPESGWLNGVAKVELYGSFADPQMDPVGNVDLQVFTFRRWNGDTEEMWDRIERVHRTSRCQSSGFYGAS